MRADAGVRRIGLLYRGWAMRRRIDTPIEVAAVAMARIRSKKYCLVVTETGRGPAARVVEPFRPATDGLIRFGTDPASRKVTEIARAGRCLLVYENDRRQNCVTLECEATVEPWPSSGPPRFKPMWRAFWPSGPHRADYVVVACRPTAMEIWDGRAVVAPDPFGRRSSRLELIDGQWRAPGEKLR